jgi:hydroxymethylpyrimidine/phosphomethylpyrimidine kinase
MFDNLITKNSNMEDIYQELSKLIDKLQINYVLIKGHVMEYSKFFRENCNEFTSVNIIINAVLVLE